MLFPTAAEQRPKLQRGVDMVGKASAGKSSQANMAADPAYVPCGEAASPLSRRQHTQGMRWADDRCKAM